ncbi:M20 metallopeptidase family protein [Lutispora thermophila]|nr:M20 family metallopeptidase [Lutispora thermophila]
MDFLKKAMEHKKKLIDIRRDFHKEPELGLEEYKTSQKIKGYLESMGIEYRSVAKTGIKAVIRGKGSKTIALRADMDALPIEEKAQHEYKSQIPGKMHACGHDAHMAVLLGAAMILKDMENELNGNVVLLFEPAEETVGGAKLMIEEGVLEDPHVDAVIGLHVGENLQCGTIGLKSGAVNAASNPFSVKIRGKGAHGAHPDMGIDPITITCNIINALQTMISRETSPTEPAVLTIGAIHAGTAENVIPDEVEFKGTIRTLSMEHRQFMKSRFREIVEGVSASMRGSAEINIIDGYPCTYNDDMMLKLAWETAPELIHSDKIIELKEPSMGVESFAYFSMERPSLYYVLGCGNKEKGIIYPGHNSRFDIDEDCLPLGSALQALLAYNFLNKK